jgi:hypothetical protein
MPPWLGGRPSSWLPSSANHFICLQENGRRNGQAERLGGPEIEHQLEFRRLLHGQVSGLGPLENLIPYG